MSSVNSRNSKGQRDDEDMVSLIKSDDFVLDSTVIVINFHDKTLSI